MAKDRKPPMISPSQKNPGKLAIYFYFRDLLEPNNGQAIKSSSPPTHELALRTNMPQAFS
jgi:hypothetical protein